MKIIILFLLLNTINLSALEIHQPKWRSFIKNFLEKYHPETRLPEMARSVLENPQNPAYSEFVLLASYLRQFGILEETLEQLREENPEVWWFTRDLADACFQQGKFTVADSLLTAFGSQPTTDFWLLKARISFQQNRDEAGAEYYTRALGLLKTPENADLIFSDLIYLISDAEFAQYDSIGLAEKPRFFRAFWNRRDPSPITPVNERIPEHFRRLFHARENYRKFVHGEVREKSHAYESAIVGITDMPDLFKMIKRPRGIETQCDLDDMGCVYVRHGAPDQYEKTPPIQWEDMKDYINIFWKYNARGPQPRLIYFFLNTVEGNTLISYPTNTKNLEMVDARFWKLPISTYRAILDENVAAVQEHIQNESGPDLDAKPLDFPYFFLNFRDSDQKTRVELFFAIFLGKLKENSQEGIHFSSGVAVFNAQWEELDSWQKEDRIPPARLPEQWQKHLVIKNRSYSLTPGTYHFAVQLRDLNSDKLGIYRGPVVVKSYASDSLLLSDILLACNLTTATAQSRLAKDGVEFTPRFSREFSRNEPVALYYEIYNLNYNSKGQTKYEVTYSVWPYSKEAEIENPRKKKPIIRTGTRQNGEKRDEKVWMSFDFSEQKKGKYVIEILVKDQVGGAEVRKLVPVEVE